METEEAETTGDMRTATGKSENLTDIPVKAIGRGTEVAVLIEGVPRGEVLEQHITRTEKNVKLKLKTMKRKKRKK